MKSWEIEQELREEGREEGHEAGLRAGRKDGRINTLVELVRDGILTEEQAAERIGVKTDFIRQRLGSVQ